MNLWPFRTILYVWGIYYAHIWGGISCSSSLTLRVALLYVCLSQYFECVSELACMAWLASKHYLWFTDTWKSSWKSIRWWLGLSNGAKGCTRVSVYILYFLLLCLSSSSSSNWLQYFATLLNFPSCNSSLTCCSWHHHKLLCFLSLNDGNWMELIYRHRRLSPLLWMNRLIEEKNESTSGWGWREITSNGEYDWLWRN